VYERIGLPCRLRICAGCLSRAGVRTWRVGRSNASDTCRLGARPLFQVNIFLRTRRLRVCAELSSRGAGWLEPRGVGTQLYRRYERLLSGEPFELKVGAGELGVPGVHRSGAEAIAVAKLASISEPCCCPRPVQQLPRVKMALETERRSQRRREVSVVADFGKYGWNSFPGRDSRCLSASPSLMAAHFKVLSVLSAERSASVV